MRYLTSILLICLTVTGAIAQQPVAVPFNSDRWQLTNKPGQSGEQVLETYLGRPCIRLRMVDAVLKDVNFTNGIIEYDAAFTPARAGIGATFRMQDLTNFEYFYIRPHQSGNPDATQYIPIIQDMDCWQLYHGNGYSAAVQFTFDQWVHFKLVVSGSQMEVYVGDMDKPALFVPALKLPVRGGTLGLSGNARFANFTYTLVDKPVIKSTATPPAPVAAGTITQWQVSNAFPEKNLDNAFQLPDSLKKGLRWQGMTAEQSGIVNLSTGPKWSATVNTVFAKVVLLSDKAQVKKLQLGFSDRAKVYLNNQILYSGHDEFRSRDYRFLGTVGYFDEVYLSLKAGRNELWIAVSEESGGWGIQGLIADRAGLTLE